MKNTENKNTENEQKTSRKKYLLIAAGVATGALAAYAARRYLGSSAPKELFYDLLSKDRNKNIELRDYKPYKAAKVVNRGKRLPAVNNAFTTLFNYISGNNSNNEKIPMTSPVSQMADGKGNWEVNFIMPKGKKLSDLPVPANTNVTIKKEKGGKFIAHKFRGNWKDKNVSKHKDMLDSYINDNAIKTDINPVHTYYNSPMRLPFLRRNEVMYKLKERA